MPNRHSYLKPRQVSAREAYLRAVTYYHGVS